jgi:NADPH-dependent 2,4-dienoyl-CoA reductase/sulfur reductase-like enzyme/rhodanese-related sulfurtransferase
MTETLSASRRVVVVGGVAGGMSAAARLRRLDEAAQIVVLEADDYVSFANCGLPYHISGDIPKRASLLLQTPRSLAAQLNLEVRVGHEVQSIDRDRRTVVVHSRNEQQSYELPYDALVLSPGAQPIRPPLPGVDHPRIFTLRNIPDMDAIKAVVDDDARSAVVIGGGYIGLEMVDALHARGLHVTLVESLPHLMSVLDPEMSREVEDHVRSHEVAVHLSTKATAFSDDNGRVRVHLQAAGNELSAGGAEAEDVTITADLVVMSVGVRPASDLASAAGLACSPRGAILVNEHQLTSDPHIYAVGDAVQVTDTVLGTATVIPLAGPANRQGRIAADHIAGKRGRSARYTTSQGSGVAKVFAMTVALTGASETALKAANRAYAKVYLHPNGHAGYYPGTAPMHLKMLYDPDDGRVLGAQIAGWDGVDKRIDVLAVAIRAGLTVEDLEELELAYAPPYSSAKDPVNMAGFQAANVLRGDLALWQADEWPALPGDALLLDVRSPAEHKTWNIRGSLLIPLPQLRERLAELPADRELYVYCRSGFRSYLAYRLLVQHGFRAKTLSGGELTFRSIHPDQHPVGRPRLPVITYAEELFAD